MKTPNVSSAKKASALRASWCSNAQSLPTNAKRPRLEHSGRMFPLVFKPTAWGSSFRRNWLPRKRYVRAPPQTSRDGLGACKSVVDELRDG
eukprot:3558354-Amphidinium_carterae.1